MIEFELNGKAVTSESPPDTPLLWVIRDELKLKGTKFGCGIAMCGACTIHLDGDALRSCVTPVSAAENRSVTTIEGLDTRASGALQSAWVEEQVPQCGYCQSGQIMQAADLLAKNPNPSDQDINEGMNGNLCRCMAYTRIRKAIKSAANGGGAVIMVMAKQKNAISRRTFIAGTAGTTLIMGLGSVLPGCSREEAASDLAAGASNKFSPTVWFVVDGTGSVLVNIAKAEMGQHVGTALARVVADELGADWSKVSIDHVDSDPKWGYMVTGGSWSVFTTFAMLSQAGAAGRTVLIEEGARMLGVEAGECEAHGGNVVCGDEQVSFAEIVAKNDIARTFTDEELAAMPIKSAEERRLIGKAAKALDIPAKSSGEAVYGLDTELPDMVYAHPLIPPTRYGSSINSIDDTAAKDIPGYMRTLSLNDPSEVLQGWAVVIAENFPAAMKAADAVEVDWAPGPTAAVTESHILAEGAKLAADPASGVKVVDDGDVAEARANAEKTHTATYRTSTMLHFTLEPQKRARRIRRWRLSYSFG